MVRLRSQVQTEADRDDERRRREELQENIIKFLDTAMEVSQGDLTKRGDVTSDVLGNVVDAINLMVAEIGPSSPTCAGRHAGVGRRPPDDRLDGARADGAPRRARRARSRHPSKR